MNLPVVILVVEDDPRDFAQHYERKFSAYTTVTLIHAPTSSEARRKLNKKGFAGFDAIILDGIINAELTQIPPSEPTTAPLARTIRAEWDKLKVADGRERLLVAASGSSDMRNMLMRAGCNRQTEKAGVVHLIAEYFRLT